MTAGPSLHVEHLFSTPLIVDTPADHEIDREALVAAVLPAAPDSGTVTLDVWNVAGEEPRFNVLAALIDYAARVATSITRDLRTPDRPPAWQACASAHLVAAGGRPDLPRRYDAYWTCLYVADDGYAATDGPVAGGELLLMDPRLPMTMMEAPRLRLLLNLTVSPTAYAPELTFRPATGQFLMVPSWLRIEPRVFEGKGKRVIIQISLIADHAHA